MPRLFTGLEIPKPVADALASRRGGLVGARWIDPANFHVTLRFIGDVDGATARELAALLGEMRPRPPFPVEIDALSAFGGARPRALIASVVPSAELLRLQAEQERVARRAGLDPETRKFTPHVTLARLRDATAGDVAAFLAMQGHCPRLSFTAARLVLFSARDSVGGGPYIVEAAYPFRSGAKERPVPPAEPPELRIG